MPPKRKRLYNTAEEMSDKERKMYFRKMQSYQLTNQWQQSVDKWWNLNKQLETVGWRVHKIFPPVMIQRRPVCVSASLCNCVSAHYAMRMGIEPPILSLESIVRGVFNERALKARMLADQEDKISVLALMGHMASDCDISLLDGLKYVSRFGIPLKKYWKTGQKAPNVPQEKLYKYRIADYKSIGNHKPTIEFMLRQFPLLCDAFLSDAVYDYKDGIYTYEMNRQGDNLGLHAMVLVGWGYSVIGDKSSESSGDLEESDEDADVGAEEGSGEDEDDVQLGDKWGQGGFGLMEKSLIRRVYYPTILPPDELPPDEI
ncbi:unnamed protein product [Malus baccata var. baccata]